MGWDFIRIASNQEIFRAPGCMSVDDEGAQFRSVITGVAAIVVNPEIHHHVRLGALAGFPIDEVVVDAVDSVIDFKFENPPQKAEGRIVGEGVDAVPELARLLREEAKVI